MLEGKGKFLAGCWIVMLCFAIVALLFYYKGEMSATLADVLKVSLGILLGYGGQIVGYYWGGADKQKGE